MISAAVLQAAFVDHPLSDGNPPSWASAWGEDQYGPWVEFRVREARQRMRWICPGEFRMGSSDDEPGRWDDEGPQHLVTITRGFWLFDTPCTQKLWKAVMETEPSMFPTVDRPVEQVSWDDCQQFVQRIFDIVPGLSLSLPTEAQWEYACRAATDTATYAGDLEILGENNAPVLHEIAWYGGNCGVEFDLGEGHPCGDWPEKQFEFAKGGTRVVAKKRPNAWGLYDMLGNVWEWCDDGLRVYSAEAITDPAGSREASADRVIRGGGWHGTARGVRVACRGAFHPSSRNDNLGFRCSSSDPEPV